MAACSAGGRFCARYHSDAGQSKGSWRRARHNARRRYCREGHAVLINVGPLVRWPYEVPGGMHRRFNSFMMVPRRDPLDVPPEDIRKVGNGAYLHRGNTLYLSVPGNGELAPVTLRATSRVVELDGNPRKHRHPDRAVRVLYDMVSAAVRYSASAGAHIPKRRGGALLWTSHFFPPRMDDIRAPGDF